MIATVLVIHCAAAVARSPFDAEPIRYSSASPDNAVSRLQKRLTDGKFDLQFDDRYGYLPAVLKALDIPISSQVLVFSKTSLQRVHISPKTPRTIYFNDETYLGWMPDGDVLEITSVDPKLGSVFYTIAQDEEEGPIIERRTESCMVCHSTFQGQRIPSHLVRSVAVDNQGHLLSGGQSFFTTHKSPFEERWGGWYVTGTHGKQQHLGNVTVKEGKKKLDLGAGANRTSLASKFDTSRYLSSHSDLVALMLLEHQTFTHNLITSTLYETRRALHDAGKVADDAVSMDKLEAVTQLRIKRSADVLVQALLFVDEAPLTSRVTGTTTFAKDFLKRGARDNLEKSFRTFDLEERMFRFPLSYLIRSDAIKGLPLAARSHINERIEDVLSARDSKDRFGGKAAKYRKAIRRFLIESPPE